uniref:Uncharacterized protein n=1 Tax=viral metagenome TaxID=1070528 RepID=A0A6M3KR23_9ZZZZ
MLRKHVNDSLSLLSVLAACVLIERRRGYFCRNDLYLLDFKGNKKLINMIFTIIKQKEYAEIGGVLPGKGHAYIYNVSERGYAVLSTAAVIVDQVFSFYRALPGRFAKLK